MDINENTYTVKPRKHSPFADSPYESAYVAHESIEPVARQFAAPTPKRWGWKLLVAVLAVSACCGTTAFFGIQQLAGADGTDGEGSGRENHCLGADVS